MVNQTFCKKIPLKLLDELLQEAGCERTATHYLYNIDSYKRLKCKNLVEPFLEEIESYYHKSKRHYVLRPISPKRLLTIIRQICRVHNIPYVSNLKYMHSGYDITYNIYMPHLESSD